MPVEYLSRLCLPRLIHPLCSALILGALLLGTLSGCATLPATALEEAPVQAERSGVDEAPSWWYLRFRLRGEEEDEVDSYLDTLIADQILAPAIARQGSDLALWRFHRRWPRDATGHQFSFIFFAPTGPARQLIAAVEGHPLLQRLADEGPLVAFRVDRAPEDRATDPAATSDRAWPPEVQREWPNFMMGASRMWLGLVRAEADKHRDLDLYARYQAVEEALDELWYTQGNHAFLHHLSALFGYKPVRVLRRETMTF